MIVFVYEDVCASAAGGDGESPPAASLLREGRAMLDAVAADFRSVPSVHVIHATSPTDFARQARIADYTLVIAPETGGRLEKLASEVIRVGGKLLGPSPDAIQLSSDKLALARHWTSQGVSTPTTWPFGDEPNERPLVIKPRDGAGSLQTWFEAGGAQSEARAKHFRPRFASGSAYLIAQEYVKGFAVSVSFLIGPNSTAPLIPCAQRLSRDGRFQYEGGYLPIAPELADRATRIATSAIECVPGLLGYIGVDIVLGEDGRDWAIEINPRLTTSYVGLRALAKFNTAEAMLAIVRGDSPPEMTWGSDSIQFTPDGQISPLAA